MRGVIAAAAALLLSAAPAGAAPRITGVEVRPAAGGEPASVVVTATDPDAPVTGVRVDRAGGGSFATSGFGPGAAAGAARFTVPLPGPASAATGLRVTVTSGAGGAPASRVSLESLVDALGNAVPAPGPLPGLPPLPALPVRAAASGACAGADTEVRGRTRGRVRRAVICMVNAERRARGLRALRSHKRLQKAAFRHSADMLARGYFAHAGPRGPELARRLRAVRYWPATAGENLAAGTGMLATARATVAAWMASPGHRANMLRPEFREIGVGIVTAFPAPPESPGATFTANFGRRG